MRIASDPYAQGLDRQVTTRLLMGKHTKADRAKYYRTKWFLSLVDDAVDATGGYCIMCGSEKGLTFHHNKIGYRRMFAERIGKDGAVVCPRCHRANHGKKG